MAVPANLKAVNSYLKLGKEYDKRDPTVAYFCRMLAVQKGIKLDSKSPDCKKFLFGLMDQLEATKKVLISQGDEAVSNDIVAQAHIENIAVNLFVWADGEDRNGVFNKSITKAFYSASLLYEVLTQFGEINDECKVQQRYAKWKAAYLNKCLKTGEIPTPGPEGSGFEDDFSSLSQVDDPTQQGPSGYNPANPPYPDQMNMPYQPTQPTQPQQPTNHPVPAPRAPTNQNIPPRAYQPEPATSTETNENANIDFEKALKFCKYATSSLQYEDVAAAVDNLTKALMELKK